jgi:hypothetical protein
MRNIVVLTAFTLFIFATTRCADAGVMLGESPSVIATNAASVSADLTPLQQEEQKQGNFHQGESSGMSGFSTNSVQTVGQPATIGTLEASLQQSHLLAFLELSNECLPASPLLDSLLKPS